MPGLEQSPFRFYAYLGPHHVAEDDPQVTGHWDWITDIIKAQSTLKYIGARTLNANLVPSSSSGLSVTGSAIPPAAGMWVGPGPNSQQTWEYISYSSSGGVLLRDIGHGNSGTHQAGAPAYFWYPLQNNTGQVQIDIELAENMSNAVWTAKLAGVEAPPMILKPEHVLVLTGSSDLTLSEAACPIIAIGIVERVEMATDGVFQGTWQMDITCSARLMQLSQIPGLRIGGLNVALQANATASSSLGANWKLTLPQYLEVGGGSIPEIDLIDLQQDCGPQNLLDDNENTLWCSDGWVAPYGSYGNSLGNSGYASIFAYPPPSEPHGCRYFEIIHTQGMAHTFHWIYAKWRRADGTYLRRWYQASDNGMFHNQSGIDDDSMVSGGGNDVPDENEQRLLVVEDQKVFERVFPAARAKWIVDASKLSGQEDMEAVRRLWWEGGAIFLRWDFGTSSGADYLVSWGLADDGEMDLDWHAPNMGGTDDFDLPTTRFHIGYDPHPPSDPQIHPGMVFRRNFTIPDGTNNQVMQFSASWLHHPGYVIDNDINGDLDNNPSRRSEWVKIELPEMSHLLSKDLAVGSSVIEVVDAQGAPNVDGFSKDGDGTVIIDDEPIDYASKDFKTGKLTGCVVKYPHKAGATVYAQWTVKAFGRKNAKPPVGYQIPEEGALLQIATNAYPIARLEWGRGKYQNGQDRTPWMWSYVWRFSPFVDMPNPTEDSYDNAYMSVLVDSLATFAPGTEPYPPIQAANVSLNTTSSFFETSEEGFRPRTLLLQIREFKDAAGNPIVARPRLNYVRAMADRDYFDPDTFLDNRDAGMSNLTQIRAMLELSGQYASFFEYAGVLDVVQSARKHGMTDRDTAWRVATDAADYGADLIYCNLNGIISLGQNGYLLHTSHTVQRTFDETTVMSLEIVNVRQAELGQIKLNWEDPNLGKAGTVYYPTSARYGGSVQEVGPVLADDETQANTMAKNLYGTKRFPYNVFIELVTPNLSIKVGEIHLLSYDWFAVGQATVKTLLVESVSHEIGGGYLKTLLGYREIERDTV